MFKPTKAKNTKEYLVSLPKERRELVGFLDKFIRTTAPKLKPHFAYNMLGYGSFPYKNYKKEMVEWPIISLASQKNYISIYICAVDNGEYVAEKYKKELGKVSVGKSCIRLKRLEDVNLPVLKKIIQSAARKPGLDGVGASAKK
jgi:Domain of unknown function (DU1801)